MSDLVEWLRKEADDWEPDEPLYSEGYRSPTGEELRKAADEIERLTAENARLKEACQSALDALEGLARNADTNVWCQELRAALTLASEKK